MGTAMIENHKRSGQNNRNLFFPEFWMLEIKVLAGFFLLRPLSLADRWPSSSLSPYGLPSVHPCPRYPLYEDTSHVGVGLTLMT